MPEKEDKEQLKRFKKAAKELGTDESEDALDKAVEALELDRKETKEGE